MMAKWLDVSCVYLGVLLCLQNTIFYSNGYFFKIRKTECIANGAYFSNVSCILKPINWTRSVLNMDCDIRDALTDIKVRSFINLSITITLAIFRCHNFLEKYAISHLTEWTNVNHSCPYRVSLYKSNFLYICNICMFLKGHLIARNFRLDEVSMPILPIQDYKIAFNFSGAKPGIHLGMVLIYFEILEDYYKHKKNKPLPKPLNFV
ncbi:GD10907 [Drosophila simulans]|uniref:GD10907 n=1 Tax=Drosophila simulans TaxID=7240 RepID=B4QDE3_DROSI|nr:GD10907 [Drosophila simulans]